MPGNEWNAVGDSKVADGGEAPVTVGNLRIDPEAVRSEAVRSGPSWGGQATPVALRADGFSPSVSPRLAASAISLRSESDILAELKVARDTVAKFKTDKSARDKASLQTTYAPNKTMDEIFTALLVATKEEEAKKQLEKYLATLYPPSSAPIAASTASSASSLISMPLASGKTLAFTLEELEKQSEKWILKIKLDVSSNIVNSGTATANIVQTLELDPSKKGFLVDHNHTSALVAAIKLSATNVTMPDGTTSLVAELYNVTTKEQFIHCLNAFKLAGVRLAHPSIKILSDWISDPAVKDDYDLYVFKSNDASAPGAAVAPQLKVAEQKVMELEAELAKGAPTPGLTPTREVSSVLTPSDLLTNVGSMATSSARGSSPSPHNHGAGAMPPSDATSARPDSVSTFSPGGL